MGGKKKGGNDKVNKKEAKKVADKIVEDKTFGLKNKNKSTAVKKYIKGIENVARQKVGLEKMDAGEKYREKAEKKKKKEEEAFLNSLYKSVQKVKTVEQEIPEGIDPKMIICENYKNGFCELGNKCPFSHDLNLQYNQGTFDIYTDLREAKKTLSIELEVNKIAEQKEQKRGKVPSNIVCKFFLEAVKRKQYGWKWECPNGDSCHYRHSLPRGYIILTAKEKAQEDMTQEEYMNLEEQIDIERARIAQNGTKVTEATFLEWKKKRDEFRKEEQKEEEEREKKLHMKSKLTGVQLFKKQAELFKDDDDVTDLKEEEKLEKEEEKNEQKAEDEKVKIDEDLFKGEDLGELDDIVAEEEETKDKENNKENNEEEEDVKEDTKVEDSKDDKEDEKVDEKEEV